MSVENPYLDEEDNEPMTWKVALAAVLIPVGMLGGIWVVGWCTSQF